ncbi:MAG: glycyl-radical enzyme activating protein [Hominenteromicrobium sp.]
MKSLIFDIQRFCVYDGPGIRTTVFFKGCNMHCAWCHNPESFSASAELLFRAEKCTSCGACAVCPAGAHTFENGVHAFHRERCVACGKCASLCPNGALELSGREMTAGDVMKIIDKDAKYYKSSGGGVTFSGGEASLHFELLIELLTACRERGYHTALETNGLIPPERLQKLIPLVDLFLFDCKHTDPEQHKRWTGAPLEPVLETLASLDRAGANVVLRCPVIPGVNDTDAHFTAIRALKKRFGCIQKAEIMAYHDIGKTKWDALGAPYTLAALKTVPPEQKRLWEAQIAG